MKAAGASGALQGRSGDYWPWLCALAGCLFDLAAFWPGLMSFDSAYAWWQVRGGETTDITSPAMIDLWRLFDSLHSGPGLLFAFHLVLFWSGLALMAHALRCRLLATVGLMVVVALAPVVWLLRAHVWTDVGLMAAMTLASGALANAWRDGRSTWLLVAAPMLVYAATLRHNALPAILPLIAWYAWILMRGDGVALKPTCQRIGIVTLMILLALLAGVTAINARVERHVPLWPSLAQFDLAAISVASGQLLLPDWMVGPGMDVAELDAAFRGWSNTPMLQHTEHGMRDPLAGFSDAELDELRSDWLFAVRTHPGAWLKHRWRLTRALFGTHSGDWPRELVFVDAEYAYRDNPPVPSNTSALHRGLMRSAETLRSSFVLAAWPYLLIGLLALPWAWRRRTETAGLSALMLLASAWLYALPLTLLAPAAELRYLGWSCLASLLATGALVFAASGPSTKDEAG